MCPSYEKGLRPISGRVVRIDGNVVHIQEFKTFARRSVPAGVVRVQTGKTRNEKALAEAEQKGQRTR